MVCLDPSHCVAVKMFSISGIVTPKDCSRCRPDEVIQYSMSKYANTGEIIWKRDLWLNKGMNSDNERQTRIAGCHFCTGMTPG